MRQLRRPGHEGHLHVGRRHHLERARLDRAATRVEGTLMTFAPDPRKNAAAKELVKKFRASRFEPEAYTLYTYAALQVIAAGRRQGRRHSTRRRSPKRSRPSGPLKTAIGEIGYDEKGDITRPDYVMYEWKKGDDGKYTYFEIANKPANTGSTRMPGALRRAFSFGCLLFNRFDRRLFCLHCSIFALIIATTFRLSGNGARPCQSAENPRRQPFRDRHPRLPRRQRTRHQDGRDLGGGGQILAAPVQGGRGLPGRARPHLAQRSGADRKLSVDRRGDPRRQAVRRRRDPSRLRLPVGKPGIRRSLRAKPASSSSARRRRPCARLGNKVAARNLAVEVGVPVVPATEPLPDDIGSGQAARRRNRLSGDAEGVMGRRRPRHARRSATEATSLREVDRGQARGQGRLRQGRGLSREAGRARPPRRGADPRRHARQRRASVRARLLDPAPQPEGRRARAGALSRRSAARRNCATTRSKIARATELCRRRHRRVPDGCRHRRILLHRGQSAHPGRAHRHRGGDRHRHRQGADPHRRRRGDRHAGDPASRRRRTSGSTATRCNAASRPRIPSRTSSRTTAGSPPIAARPASASASTAAPPIPARSSPASTIRCSRRSPPGRRRPRRRSRACTGRCASSASAAWRPT